LLSAPAAAASDPRLVELAYDPAQIVVVEGKLNVQATIRFDSSEQIENVAIGDSSTWQVTPNKGANLLFVKPLAERASTNMTVVTSRRTYLFDLVASPAHKSPLYVMSFNYPEDEAAAALAAAAPPPEGANGLEMQAASDPYAVVDPAELNFAWAGNGDKQLLPERIYDDGEATFIAWGPDTPLPAILIRDHEGTEGPVNFAVRGDLIVVDGVPRELILRSGDNVATMVNQGPVRQPVPPKQSALAQASKSQSER
jgi:type IV secretion system protein VirB9